METWKHGNMETWKHGNMETWKHGNMETFCICEAKFDSALREAFAKQNLILRCAKQNLQINNLNMKT